MMRIIIEGDESRYQFFRKIVVKNILNTDITTENLQKKTVYVVSDKSRVGDDVYYSKLIPLHTELVFPVENENFALKDRQGDKILIFDEFPYRRWNEKNKQNIYLKMYDISRCEIVLMKNQRKALKTDISTEESALKDADEEYKAEGFPVIVYSGEDKIDFIFNHQVENIDEQFLKKILSAKNKIEEEMDSDYEISFEFCKTENGIGLDKLLQPSILDNFVKYNSHMNGQNVMEIYFNEAYQYFWKIHSKSILNFALGLYKKYIKDICLWNLEKDIDCLKIKIWKLFRNYVIERDELIFNGSEEDYPVFVNSNAEKILNFKTKINNFFKEEMRNAIKEQMLDRICGMEAMINEKTY